MAGDDKRVGPGPKYPLSEVIPKVGAAHITRMNAIRRVCGELGCSEVEAAAVVRQKLRTLTVTMFSQTVRYADGVQDDQYFVLMEDGEYWYVKLRIDGNRLFVTAFHPQDVSRKWRPR